MASPLVYCGLTLSPAPNSTPPFKFGAASTSTVYVKLRNLTGVTSWNIEVVSMSTQWSTDATVAIVDNVNKIAAVTLNTAKSKHGNTVLLRSTVNNGIDSSGQYDAGLISTFVIVGTQLLASNVVFDFMRQIAPGETFEQDATYGWSGIVNEPVRTLQTMVTNDGASVSASQVSLDIPGAYCALTPASSGAVLHSLNYLFSYNGEIFNFYNVPYRIIRNVHASYNLVLKHNTTELAATGKFICPGAADMTLTPGQAAFLFNAKNGTWYANKMT